MIELDSDILRGVLPALGRGTPAQRPLEFDDELLQQSLDVSSLVRRGGTVFPTAGIFGTAAVNTHAAGAASTVTARFTSPYQLEPGTDAIGAWPDPKSMERYDVWLLNWFAQVNAVSGNFTAAQLIMQTPARNNMEWTPTGASSAPLTGVAINQTLDYWDTENTSMSPMPVLLAKDLTTNGDARRAHSGPVRIPPFTDILFQSRTTAAGASEYQIVLQIGLFPAALGQDAVGAG